MATVERAHFAHDDVPALDDSALSTPRDEKAHSAVDADDEPPDGGLEAWGCIACAFFLLFCIFGFVTSMGQLELYYMAHQLSQYSKATIAWIASVQSCLTFLFSMFSGRMLDSHGTRGIVIAGSSMAVISLISLAFCKEYYQFLLAHALLGLAGSVIYAPATAISGHWFKKRRGTAVGIVVTGSGAGGVVYPVMMSQLFKRLSFRDTMLIIAGMNIVLMLPSWFFLKARVRREVAPWRDLLKPWKEVQFTFLVIGSAVTLLNFFTPYFNAAVLATSNNASFSEWAVLILQGGSFVGRAVAGVLADRFGVWTVFITASLSQGIAILAFWTGYPLPEAVVILGLLGFGLASGAWLTLVSASTASISPPVEVGMRMGLLWTCGSIPILVGPVVSGVLITADGNRFTYAGIFAGITLLLGPIVTIVPAVWKRFRRL